MKYGGYLQFKLGNCARELSEVGVEVPTGGMHSEDMGLHVGGVGSATKQGDFGEAGEQGVGEEYRRE